MDAPLVSIIIPAFNEAKYLPSHLPSVIQSLDSWMSASHGDGEIILVDNSSDDDTAELAQSYGVRVISEPVRSIGRARNSGANAALGRYLFFVDADVTIPLDAVAVAVSILECGEHIGGAIQPRYRPRRMSARLLCAYWDRRRTRHRDAQGVNHFCTAEAFRTVGGYRTDWYMSEDVEFFARLRTLGDNSKKPVALVSRLHVEPSTRRYDLWPAWKILWWQNPIVARIFPKSPSFWRAWYQSTPR